MDILVSIERPSTLALLFGFYQASGFISFSSSPAFLKTINTHTHSHTPSGGHHGIKSMLAEFN